MFPHREDSRLVKMPAVVMDLSPWVQEWSWGNHLGMVCSKLYASMLLPKGCYFTFQENTRLLFVQKVDTGFGSSLEEVRDDNNT